MIDDLLSRLDRVKETGKNRWIARCPTRDDKTPSLSIRLLDDGRILLHDFGGDDVVSILAAIGLGFDALFPDKPIPNAKRERISPADALRCISFEATLAAVAAANIAQGIEITSDDRARLFVAAGRINSVLEVCHVSQ